MCDNPINGRPPQLIGKKHNGLEINWVQIQEFNQLHLRLGLLGYLIPFASLAFISQVPTYVIIINRIVE